MEIPLIYRRNDEIKNAGTYTKTVKPTEEIELSFKPRSSLSIRSGPFNWTKNKIVGEMRLAATWDNTGALKVHVEPHQEDKIQEVINMVAWCYTKVLDYDGLSSDEFVEIAPGMWMLESDLALAHLDKAGQEELDQALSKIFTEKPKMFLIITPSISKKKVKDDE